MKTRINMILSLTTLLAQGTPGTIMLLSPVPTPAQGLKSFELIISAVVQLMFLVAGLATFMYLILGGIKWITSGGDSKKTQAAGDQLTAALIGLAIVAVAWALMVIIEKFFNIHILTGFSIPQPY